MHALQGEERAILLGWERACGEILCSKREALQVLLR